MKRLAIYAHFGASTSVALHIFFSLKELRSLGFQICFVSNSEISSASEVRLKMICERVLVRENTGLDFSMWKAALDEYDFFDYDELLLTNSSIIGPLRPLTTLWNNSFVSQCDFWGLTDNCDYSPHIQSFFIVFRRDIIQSECFQRFWSSVLPYTDKSQVIRSYEIGLTSWFQQNDFKWFAIFPQIDIWKAYLSSKGSENLSPSLKDILKRLLLRKLKGVPNFVHDHWWSKRLDVDDLNPSAKRYLLMHGLPGADTTLYYPKLLLEAGMPYLKAALLKPGNGYLAPFDAYALLQDSGMPMDAVQELNPSNSAGTVSNPSVMVLTHEGRSAPLSNGQKRNAPEKPFV